MTVDRLRIATAGMFQRQVTIIAVCAFSASFLTGCGQSNDEKINAVNSGTAEAPEFEEPTMDNLKGIPQPFPAKYPLPQYPNSKVILAYVKKDLRPGWKNQVMLESTDQITPITKFYSDKLVTDGWKMTYKWENDLYSSTLWQKGDKEIEVRVCPNVGETKRDIQLFSGPLPEKKFIEY